MAEIYLIIISLCFTFAEPFNNIFLFVESSCALVSGNTNKSLRPKEGRKEWPTDWTNDQASEFRLALNSYFTFCKIVVKMYILITLGLFKKFWSFHVVVLQKSAKIGTKIMQVHSQCFAHLYCFLSNVAIAVVVFLNFLEAGLQCVQGSWNLPLWRN